MYQFLDYKDSYIKKFNDNHMKENMNNTMSNPLQEEKIHEINSKSNELKNHHDKPESMYSLFFLNRNQRLRGIWYLLLPLTIGLLCEWYYKIPLSFNWPIFKLMSIYCFLSLLLMDKKIGNSLSRINRDLKIIFTTILVLIIIGIFIVAQEYTYYLAEYFHTNNFDAENFCYLVYLPAMYIMILWNSKEKD